MKKQREQDGTIIRSGTRIRESVRSLPQGHFQQIRQMFDKQSCSTKKLSTIYERQQPKSLPSHLLHKLPVTDDEKLKHAAANLDDVKTENEKSLEERYRDYLAGYQAFRVKLTNEFIQHKTIYPSLEQTRSLPHDDHSNKETLSHTTSLPPQQQQSHSASPEKSILTNSESILNKNRQLAMSAAINYTDSYESSTSSPLKRSGSTRQYVSSLQHTLAVHAKPVLVTHTTPTHDPIKRTQPTITNETYDTTKQLFQPSRRLYSSTSLSSTGYDSNSSPSIKSKRNSIATNNSNDFIIPSTYSSSSSTTSSDEQLQRSKPWTLYDSNTTKNLFYDDVFENSTEPSSLISRTQIKLNQPTFDHRPVPVIRHATIRNTGLVDSPPSSSSSSSIHEAIIPKKKINNSSYVVQTTSFPDDTDGKVDKKIRRWENVYAQRVDIVNTPNRNRKHPLTSTSSTGFQVTDSNNKPTQLSTFTPIPEQKQINEREESPVTIVDHSTFHQLPPKKPPRTFEQENKYDHLSKTNSKKVASSSSSNSNSPTFDLGTRSVSCMDLTAGVSNAVLSSGFLPLEHEHTRIRSNVTSEKTKKSIAKENIYKELKTSSSISKKNETHQILFNSSQPQSKKAIKTDVILRTPTTKTKANHSSTTIKSVMKKGVSEPNLPKASRSKSPFSPRGLLDRFKRILPLSLSKQSLNDKSSIPHDNLSTGGATIDSDDSASTSSENNDHIRTSRLDHVSRVKNVYDSLSISNPMTSLLTDPNLLTSAHQLTSLYDYVVHILPEQEVGYFSNGNGCLLSSNINQQQQISTSTSIRFKYPLDANDEKTLKYFCFPDQHDSNNNPLLLTKKTTQEYFRFTLTNMHGIRQYGYCSRFFHKSILNALCIVSPYDMIELYEKILSTATELFISYKDDDARNFLKEIYSHRLPSRGDTIHIDTTTVGLYTLKCEFDRRKELIDSVTLLSLSTDTIIKIFSSILYEQKIIFIGNDLGPLTRLINTFNCLLYPFSWPHTYVPILPALMLDIIQAPTPYIIGILRSCESYLSENDDLISQDSSDIVIIDIDNDRVRSISDYITGESYRGSTENLNNLPLSPNQTARFQILPKIFKIELKQEISLLRKTKISLSLDDCQQRLRDVFMSIFVQSCYNYKDFLNNIFQREEFVQSKQHTIELFLEWFTRTQIFELFIRQKFESNLSNQFAITFDLACEKYSKTLNKQITQRITAKSVKRKSATRANKQDNRL